LHQLSHQPTLFIDVDQNVQRLQKKDDRSLKSCMSQRGRSELRSRYTVRRLPKRPAGFMMRSSPSWLKDHFQEANGLP
jgi:hypothetical protein